MLLLATQVAEKLGVDRRTIFNWTREGLLRCVKTPGGRRRYDEDYIANILYRLFNMRAAMEPYGYEGRKSDVRNTLINIKEGDA